MSGVDVQAGDMPANDARAKDLELAARARRLAETAMGGLAWFRDNPGLVGNRLEALERTCRQHAVEARRLANAAERPMSVGVFGASQAGKSFLIGSLITPAGRPAKVLFGTGAQAVKRDFLEEVNPQGGKETTGVVTRFSIRPHPTPPGHDVVLRLLREIDIVKILANAFVFDLGAQADPDALFTAERLAALEAAMPPRRRAGRVDTLVVEDVFELRAYLAHSLPRHPLSERAGAPAARYWACAEAAAPYLSAADRTELLAPLWGELPEFTRLYRELKDALDLLGDAQQGAADFAYVPLDTITERTRSLVHVDTLLGLDGDDPAAAGLVPVLVPGRPVVLLRKPVVTALTAELRVVLDEPAWPFFEHTDLLDFPGARSREDSTPDRLLRAKDKPQARAYCFLRGKVAVLFDKYAADLDLNTMLLCVGDSNQDVAKLPELVQDWVGVTHGATAEERARRAGRRTSLFFCLTKADKLFDFSTGTEPAQSVANRLDSSVSKFSGWTRQWLPGRPFTNLFFIRNPKGIQREDLFDYAVAPELPAGAMPPEARLRPDKAQLVERYRQAFLADPMVRTHVADPAGKWEGMLALNDGGIRLLAEQLAPVCDPDLKFDQVAPRVAALADELEGELASFHEAGDLAARVERRLEGIEPVILAFEHRPMLFGPFLAELQASTARLAQRFLEIARRQILAGPERSVLGLRADPARPAPMRFGDAAVQVWLDDLERKAGDEELARAFGLTCEHFRAVVGELAVGARRFGVAQRVEAHVRATEAFAQTAGDVMHRVALGSGLIIDRLVNLLGTDLRLPDQAEVPVLRKPAPLSVGQLPSLSPDKGQMESERFERARFWLLALRLLTRDNAAWGQGGLVDVEQNRRLGLLLDGLRGSK
ncbi:virulence factor SrfC family protein [Geminicoccus roseus]|uniref:virulence factor SrfC family protein n=1 Tax=Geminicoccus roseus TaxID=404900 RepID=UPI00048675DD|nr:virulence factor SrfC family protein [Geminicoccus roseus]